MEIDDLEAEFAAVNGSNQKASGNKLTVE